MSQSACGYSLAMLAALSAGTKDTLLIVDTVAVVLTLLLVALGRR